MHLRWYALKEDRRQYMIFGRSWSQNNRDKNQRKYLRVAPGFLWVRLGNKRWIKTSLSGQSSKIRATPSLQTNHYVARFGKLLDCVQPDEYFHSRPTENPDEPIFGSMDSSVISTATENASCAGERCPDWSNSAHGCDSSTWRYHQDGVFPTKLIERHL